MRAGGIELSPRVWGWTDKRGDNSRSCYRGWSLMAHAADRARLDPVYQHDVQLGALLAEAFDRDILGRVPEGHGLLPRGELKQHQAVRLPVPFQHLVLPTAHQVAAAVLGDQRSGCLPVLLVLGGIAHVCIHDGVHSHGAPSLSFRATPSLGPEGASTRVKRAANVAPESRHALKGQEAPKHERER